MLLIDEAIKYFSQGLHNAEFKSPDTKYAALALAALEKRKPALVHHERTFWTYKHRCPSCENLLEREGLRYCGYCGQRLDWSTYETGLKYVR